AERLRHPLHEPEVEHVPVGPQVRLDPDGDLVVEAVQRLPEARIRDEVRCGELEVVLRNDDAVALRAGHPVGLDRALPPLSTRRDLSDVPFGSIQKAVRPAWLLALLLAMPAVGASPEVFTTKLARPGRGFQLRTSSFEVPVGEREICQA